MPDEQKVFQQIVDVSLEFNQAKDVDLLLEKILNAARRLANADAGTIYIEEEDILRYHHTQDDMREHYLAPEENLLHPLASLPAVKPSSIAADVTTR